MNKLFAIVSVCMLSLFVITTGCESSGESNDNSLFAEEKSGLEKDLENLNESMDELGNDIEDKLNINEGPIERNFEEAQDELELAKNDLEEAMNDLSNSTEDNWEETKAEVEAARRKLEQDLENLEQKIQG